MSLRHTHTQIKLIVCGWRVFRVMSFFIYYEHANFRPSSTAKHAAFQCVCMLREFCKKVTLWLLESIGQMSKSYLHLFTGQRLSYLNFGMQWKTKLHELEFPVLHFIHMHMNPSEKSTKNKMTDGPWLYF